MDVVKHIIKPSSKRFQRSNCHNEKENQSREAKKVVQKKQPGHIASFYIVNKITRTVQEASQNNDSTDPFVKLERFKI